MFKDPPTLELAMLRSCLKQMSGSVGSFVLLRNLRPRELEGLLRVVWWQSWAPMQPSWCSAWFFQEPRAKDPRRICLRISATDPVPGRKLSLSHSPISFPLGKSLCLVSLGLFTFLAQGLQKARNSRETVKEQS